LEKVIRVADIHKKFKVFHDKGQTFKEKFLFRNRNHYENRWVLEGVSFEIEKGDVVGLIGKNGCGKSTLLKLLTKIMYPDKGEIKIDGRVSSLIELGAGFHPEMCGKENIYTNASIFGLSKKEIDKRLDEIIAFSELEEYINNPVRTYSSGMYMRLAFSVAINVDADILLIDEILAVGDARFQLKCFERLDKLKSAGTTIVIVTHNLSTVEDFCTKAIWLNNGKIVSMGDPGKTTADYLQFMTGTKSETIHSKKEPLVHDIEPEVGTVVEITEEDKQSINYEDNRFGLKYVEITGVEILNSEGQSTNVLKSFEPASIAISFRKHKNLDGYVFGYSINTLDGTMLTGSNTSIGKMDIRQLKKQGRAVLQLNQVPVVSGKYVLQVAIVDQDGVPMDFYKDYCHFDVVSDGKSVGLFAIDHSWEIENILG